MGHTDELVRVDGQNNAHRARRRCAAVAAVVAALVVVASGCVFNGTWAATAAPVVPVQGQSTAFTDVSCVSDDWCMGVGSFGLLTSHLPMVQIWDGTSWSVAQAPPVAPSTSGADMVTVDCGTPTSCMARINRYPDGPDDFEFVVAWDGETWFDVPPGGVLDGPVPDVAPYSCTPDGSCLVIRQMDEVTVVWDGEDFTTTPYSSSPPGGDVVAVDCVDAADCTALLDFQLSHWNGSAWSAVPDSDLVAFGVLPPGSVVDGIPWVCSSSSDCITYGTTWPANEIVGVRWDGVAWSSDPMPATSPLLDLSCAGSAACVGVTASVPRTTVAWNGSDWYAAPAPPAGLGRLSCLPLRCLAVGATGTPLKPIASTYTWTDT